jgi:DNA-binding LacI/PurR family transcriptional regulator
MATARDVANELGVALSTVGRALADDPRISAATKARVRAAAERIGYVGNTPARIMRGGSSKLIGLMIPDVANEFYASIAQSLSECMDSRGYRLVLMLTGDDRLTETRQIREMVSARAAGLILVPTASPTSETRALLGTLRFVQFLRRVPLLGGAWFGIDDENAIAAATFHLIGMGHRRIGYIGGKQSLSTGAARLKGFRAACAAAGLPATHALEVVGEPTIDVGERGLRTLLAAAVPPTALVTASVHITLGVITEMERQGLAVPDRLSLVGFGDPPWFGWWRGGITAVRAPIRELARSCASWLLDSLEAPTPAPRTDYAVSCASALVIRRSVRAC